jgi:hypothetical protein
VSSIAAAAVVVIAAACGAFDAADTPAADAAGDGGAADGSAGDAAVGVAPNPRCRSSEVECNGKCVPANDCAACSGSPFLCPTSRACVMGCDACPGANGPLRVECVACNTNQTEPVGTCASADAGAFCLSGDYSASRGGSPGAPCNCNNTQVSECLSPSHVCINASGEDYCRTCGEPGTQGKACKSGKTCDEAAASCK